MIKNLTPETIEELLLAKHLACRALRTTTCLHHLLISENEKGSQSKLTLGGLKVYVLVYARIKKAP